MSDELVFYTNPMSRGGIARWMLEEVGQPYQTEILEFGPSMKGPGYLGDQSDGQSAGDPPRRYDRHRSRGDLRLSRRRLSGGRPRAAARMPTARPLLSLALLRRRSDRGRGDRQGPRVSPRPRPRAGTVGYGNLRHGDRGAGERGRRAEYHRRRSIYRGRRLCRLADRLRHAFGIIERRPAFERYWELPRARARAAVRAREIDDNLVAEREKAKAAAQAAQAQQ